jgi:hypothetical protein
VPTKKCSARVQVSRRLLTPAALQQSFPELCILDATTGLPARSALDTVERFQSGERTLILVSAIESDRAYLLASCEILLDPRRLTVARAGQSGR